MRRAIAPLAVTTALALTLGAHAADPKTVAGTVAADPSFKTLAKALAETDLAATLDGDGPFTLFAPTDAAFARIGKAQLDALLADKDRLKAVLSFHVLEGKHASQELAGMKKAKTLHGADVLLDLASGKVNGAHVSKKDIEAKNGVIHAIDSVLAPPAGGSKEEGKDVDSFYALSTTTLEGKPFELSQLKGKVTLVVNVASECGFTPQYAGLEKLHEELSGRGFSVVGFPSNEFGGQEPGGPAEIRKFCDAKYGVTFTLFSKVVTKPGKDQSPIYTFLTKGREAPSWNFCKYLIGKDGKVIQFYPSRVTPQDDDLRKAIEAALK